MREGTSCTYKGTPKPILMAGEVIPGFEIFVEYVNEIKKTDTVDVPVEELILAEEELEEDITTLELKDVDGQNEEFVMIISYICFL